MLDTARRQPFLSKTVTLHSDLTTLREEFLWIVFRQEMKKRLGKLKITLTKELQRQIKSLYKRHSA